MCRLLLHGQIVQITPGILWIKFNFAMALRYKNVQSAEKGGGKINEVVDH